MADIKLIGEGNQPINLNKLESPILGMEIHINTETSENTEGDRDDEWIPSRRTRITCMLAGTLFIYKPVYYIILYKLIIYYTIILYKHYII